MKEEYIPTDDPRVYDVDHSFEDLQKQVQELKIVVVHLEDRIKELEYALDCNCDY